MENVIKQDFIHWYFEEFKLDSLHVEMTNAVEDSPWHRERNVGVHTDMVVSEYLARSTIQDFDVRGALGCAFHDVGKPSSEILKYREDRGEYRAYHGHELVSARLWEDYAVRNWEMLRSRFCLQVKDIYTIGWMIEHHVPWATKKDDKLNAFAITAYETLRHNNTWTNMLLADQYGRVSDDSHQHYEAAAEWILDHDNRRYKAEHRWRKFEDKTVYMLIGAPGSGKSTHRYHLGLQSDRRYETLCMDDLRMEWYDQNDYANAFAKATKDSSFNAKVDKVYVEMLRNNDYIILDNTNTSAKARRRWIAPAKARNFNIVAMLFPSTMQQVKSRQSTRLDKTIPLDVVDNMYSRMSLPMYGEFDDVIVTDGNLPA